MSAFRDRLRRRVRANLNRLRDRGLSAEVQVQEAALAQLEAWWREQDRAERWAREIQP